MNYPDITNNTSDTTKWNATRLIYQLFGHVFFTIGAIGILIPIMPTTVFWICAAGCYIKSSPEKYHRLVSSTRYGETIARFIEYGVISRPDKKAATLGIILSALITLLLPITLFAMSGLLVAILLIWSRPEQTGQ